ncbi:hypothetical protein GE09DRAFT_1067866 [Coniochaeta sp. 2T2.1]|nr:hypothetical protein GE09DRAFT_1067866 [Coniochaeta sp. 2T2.1]
MKLHPFTALAAASFAYAQSQTIATWLSTSHIREEYFSTSTIQYSNTPITPVPSKTEPIVLVTSIVTEPTASRNFNFTSFYTAQVTLPVTTQVVTVRSPRPSPPTITLSGTATTTVWATPTIATVTFASTLCANGNSTLPSTTTTKYTGTYSPFPGQPSTLPTIFPTAVTTWFRVTAFYKVYPYTGPHRDLLSHRDRHELPLDRHRRNNHGRPHGRRAGLHSNLLRYNRDDNN